MLSCCKWICGIGMIGLILAGSGCTRTVNRTAERKIRDVLPEVIGPARVYNAHVDNPAGRTLEGKIARVTIDGQDVRLANGVLLDRLHLDLRDVEVDTSSKSVKSIRSALFQATLSEATIDHYLAGESPEGEKFRGTRVAFGQDNLVTISGERVVLGLGVPYQLRGPVRLTGPKRVEMDPRHLTVIGLPIAGKPLGFIKTKFESSLDLSMLSFPVTLTSIRTEPGLLHLDGSADVMSVIHHAQSSRP